MGTEGVSAILGLVFWAVVARLFADSEVGVGAALIASGTLVAVLSTLGFNFSLVRFLPEPGAHISRLINTSVTIGCGLASVLALAFVFGAGAWSPVLGFLGQDPGLTGLFAFFVAVWAMSLLFDAAFIGLGRAKYVLLRAVVFNSLKIPLPLALVATFSAPFAMYAAWGIGLLVANGIAAGVLFGRVVPAFRLRPNLDRTAVVSTVRYSFANHVTNVLGVLPGLVFPLLIAHILPAENAGYFYIAWAIANLLFVVPASIFTSVFAEGSRWPSSLRGDAFKGLLLSFAILVPAVVVVLVSGHTMLVAFKASFAVAMPLLVVLALTSFFFALNSAYITILRVKKRMGPVIGLFAVTTVGALALGVVLMPVIGLVGAGAGFGVVQAASAVYSFRGLASERILPVRG